MILLQRYNHFRPIHGEFRHRSSRRNYERGRVFEIELIIPITMAMKLRPLLFGIALLALASSSQAQSDFRLSKFVYSIPVKLSGSYSGYDHKMSFSGSETTEWNIEDSINFDQDIGKGSFTRHYDTLIVQHKPWAQGAKEFYFIVDTITNKVKWMHFRHSNEIYGADVFIDLTRYEQTMSADLKVSIDSFYVSINSVQGMWVESRSNYRKTTYFYAGSVNDTSYKRRFRLELAPPLPVAVQAVVLASTKLHWSQERGRMLLNFGASNSQRALLIYDLLGRKVLEKVVPPGDVTLETALQRGVYFVRFDDSITTIKASNN